MSQVIVDHQQRQQAINAQGSYIVQAPAGSGKTGLLVQRILVLLARVQAPEEVLAITFTRKAASEMRERIILALRDATENPEPQDEYQRVTWQLARKVLQQDLKQDWGLMVNPSRLRIQTIDALCATLVYQMPLLSHFGAVPDIAENATLLYKKAAINTIDELESDAGWSEAIGYLVAHLDNRLDYCQNLICSMLAKRDQWLRHVADPYHPSIDRDNLESALSRLIEGMLHDLQSVWPDEKNAAIFKLLTFASKQLPENKSPALTTLVSQASDLPGFTIDQLAAWKTIAEFVLTQDGSVRKSVNKNQGFPAKTAARDEAEQALFADMKQAMTSLLDSIRDLPSLQEKLHLIRQLPDPHYTEEEWQTLQALFELLRVAAAQLELVFMETGSVDFTAMSRAALNALGEPDHPTDLALALDYQINHILVDEFQDTSLSQFELIRRLTAGWQPGDHRTLFLVGDPMQSIYRFREAEVGLFLEAWESGIGDIDLQTIHLQVNFRSQAGIIDWVNKSFKYIMPAQNDMESGAVSYVDSMAFHQEKGAKACRIYPYLDKQEVDEAEQIRDIINNIRQQNPSASIAILVRGRTHLFDIVNTLRNAALKFRAVELESLSQRPVIQDLLALYTALSQPADKIAWLGVLRAPWCGLSLADIHCLCVMKESLTLLELIAEPQYLQAISKDGQARLQRVLSILQRSLEQTQRQSIRDWIEGTWCLLGGPAAVQDETDLKDADVFFQLLETMDGMALSERSQVMQQAVSRLFALADVSADESLQIMTIHKSKGLEFDAVILPGLGYKPSANDSDLMKWFERPTKSQVNDLLMAPIKQAGGNINKKYQLLANFEKNKEYYENGRLLYVAVTRARQQLHLLGHIKSSLDKGVVKLRPPASGSLLSALWPAVRADFEQVLEEKNLSQPEPMRSKEPLTNPAVMTNRISRLPVAWVLPQTPPSCLLDKPMADVVEELVEFDWAGEAARIIGTVVHELLQDLSALSLQQFTQKDMADITRRGRTLLIHHGLHSKDLEASVDKVMKSVDNCLKDPRGQWILSADHQQQQSEYALTAVLDNELKRIVIDRTFVDEQGNRWIIDYKTGGHSGAGKDEFLDRELQRYRGQLDTYARIVARIDNRPIKLGLYFPLLQGWREWGFTPDYE